jgi:Amt family ammonium transporter
MGFILFKIVDLILPIRVSAQEEETGLDLTQHDEKL